MCLLSVSPTLDEYSSNSTNRLDWSRLSKSDIDSYTLLTDMLYCYALLQNLDPGDQNIDDAWETFKCAIHESASKFLGKPHVPRK